MRSIQFRLPIKPIQKSNSYRIARNRMYKTQACKDFERAIGEAAKQHWEGEPSDKPMRVTIEIGVPTRRRFDLDNSAKAILDGMIGIAYHDDNTVVELRMRKTLSLKKPYVSVILEELEDETE